MDSLILAVETSSPRCSVALYGQSLSEQIAEDMPRGHHDRVLMMVQELLHRHGIGLDAISLFAFGCGPGSFTGLRIGAGVVQGLAFGQEAKVVSVSSLRALALGAFRKEPSATQTVLTLVDAHMGEIYTGYFSVSENCAEPLVEEALQSPEQLASGGMQVDVGCLVVGDACERYEELATLYGQRVRNLKPEAADVASLAAFATPEQLQSPQGAQPVYLRGPGAWKRLSEQGRR